jgi:hypothetical protein
VVILLDLVYLGVATISIAACWWFVRACDRL